MFLDIVADDGTARVEAVLFHLAHFLEAFEAAHEGLEGGSFGRGRRPWGWLVHLAKLGDAQGIGFIGLSVIGLGARKLRTTKGFDLGRIDDGDGVAVLVKKAGQGIAVGVGSFQASMDGAAIKPFLEPLKACLCIGKGFVAGLRGRLGGIEEGGVEVCFADV